mmetsp:Transcript_25515/g.36583  ORF Transcript_25515/g.36583 Transcript_25515/m.36583 type:complete len:225 (+) Transcript_25515:1328-2002(+)
MEIIIMAIVVAPRANQMQSAPQEMHRWQEFIIVPISVKRLKTKKRIPMEKSTLLLDLQTNLLLKITSLHLAAADTTMKEVKNLVAPLLTLGATIIAVEAEALHFTTSTIVTMLDLVAARKGAVAGQGTVMVTKAITEGEVAIETIRPIGGGAQEASKELSSKGVTETMSNPVAVIIIVATLIIRAEVLTVHVATVHATEAPEEGMHMALDRSAAMIVVVMTSEK